jgi:hypothetical protein
MTEGESPTEPEEPTPTPYYCKWCQNNIEVTKPIEFANHVKKCKKEFNREQMRAYRQKRKEQEAAHQVRETQRKKRISHTLKQHHQKITAPTPEDMIPIPPARLESSMAILSSALSDLDEPLVDETDGSGREVGGIFKKIGKTTLRVASKIIFRDEPSPPDYTFPLESAPRIPTDELEIFDIIGDVDPEEDGFEIPEEEPTDSDMLMVTKSQLESLVEQQIEEQEASQEVSRGERTPPRALQEYQRERQQRQNFMSELMQWVEEGGEVPDSVRFPPREGGEGLDDRELQMATRISQKGFSFGLRPASVFQEVKDFRRASLIFINQDKFEAFYYLADDFIHAFWQWCGGYGLDDHKKYIAQEELSKLNRLFKHLRGELRRQKEYKNLRNFVENNVFRRLMEVVHAVMTDTLQQRETDHHEINIEKAKAYIHGAEDEGEAFRSLGWGAAEDRYGDEDEEDVEEEEY